MTETTDLFAKKLPDKRVYDPVQEWSSDDDRDWVRQAEEVATVLKTWVTQKTSMKR